jgi:hypothetical protein
MGWMTVAIACGVMAAACSLAVLPIPVGPLAGGPSSGGLGSNTGSGGSDGGALCAERSDADVHGNAASAWVDAGGGVEGCDDAGVE